jgi:hypothetical protein
MAGVVLTQYVRPDGRAREVHCEVPDDISMKASRMDLSCEVLTTGQVAIYAGWKDDEDELMLLASNRPGAATPQTVLISAIEQVWLRFGAKTEANS